MFVANYRFHLKILTRVRALIVGPECCSGADIGHAEEYPIRQCSTDLFPSPVLQMISAIGEIALTDVKD